jgi:hypothetical protein
MLLVSIRSIHGREHENAGINHPNSREKKENIWAICRRISSRSVVIEEFSVREVKKKKKKKKDKASMESEAYKACLRWRFAVEENARNMRIIARVNI